MKLFLVFLVICCSVCSYAQDQLFKKDNTKLEVKVLEITPGEIKYKLFNNPDGPLYTILKSEVALIIYKNGQHEAFADAPQQTLQTVMPIYEAMPGPMVIDTSYLQVAREKKKEFKNLTKRKNVIFLNSAELLNSGVGMSYFREFFQNRIDVHVPISLSFDRPLISNQYNSISAVPQGVSSVSIQKKDIDVGLGVYANTSNIRAITHFIGPLFRYVQFSGTCTVPTFTTSSSFSSYGYTTNSTYNCVYRQFQVLINNGFLYRFTPHFNMMLNAAFGIATSRDFSTDNPVMHTYYFSELSIAPAFQLGFSFGYRF